MAIKKIFGLDEVRIFIVNHMGSLN